MNVSAQPTSGLKIPFDHQRLDRLMDEAGIDVVIATSKHNVQYLLGGHRANFFDYMDATGITRYLPVVIYPKGKPEKAAYIGHRLEKFQHEIKPLWTPETQTSTAGSVDAMQKAVDYMRKAGIKPKRIATEFGFLPYDASKVLRGGVSRRRLGRRALCAGAPARQEIAGRTGEAENRLGSRARLDAGGDRQSRAGRHQDRDRRSAAPRGDQPRAHLRILPDHLRHQSQPRAVRRRSGARATSCRSTPAAITTAISATSAAWRSRASRTPNWSTCLGEIETIQRAALKPIRAGAMGREIYAAAEPLRAKSKHHNHLDFLAHGMGMVSHEAPRLTNHGPVPYPCEYADMPLEAGMVVSVETTLMHPARGFIKLEDTVVVTDSGHEIYGEGARGWNRAGTAAG